MILGTNSRGSPVAPRGSPAVAASGPELLVELRRELGRPLRAQLEDGLRQATRAGRLAAGARLPASRVLAADLGVSRRLVVDAYQQLIAEGYLVSESGAGTFVAAAGAASAPAQEQAPEPPLSRRARRVRAAPGAGRAPAPRPRSGRRRAADRRLLGHRPGARAARSRPRRPAHRRRGPGAAPAPRHSRGTRGEA